MQNKKYIVKQMIYLMLKKLKEFDCYNEFISNLRQTDDFKNCNIFPNQENENLGIRKKTRG